MSMRLWMTALALSCVAMVALPPTTLHAATVLQECTVKNSRRADVRAVVRDVASYLGKCITVRGTGGGRRIYADVDAVYRRPQRENDPSSNGGTLGYDYFGSDRHDEDTSTVPPQIELTGRLRDCDVDIAEREKQLQAERERLKAQGKDAIVFVGGYCHYYRGLYLAVTQYRVLGGSALERQLPARAAPDFGDLEPAGADWPLRARVEAIANQFLQALQSQDASTMAQLHDVFWRDVQEKQLDAFLFTEADSPYAELRTPGATPELRILVRRRWDDRTDTDSSFICFCRSSDCTQRWPIDSRDANNLASRPYVCNRLDLENNLVVAGRPRDSKDESASGPILMLKTYQALSGLVEPPRRR